MGVNKLKAPAGSRVSDFDGLSNWTIADIATAKNTAPNDRQNAEFEIARRQKLGKFSLSDAEEKSTKEDLAEHGFAIAEGHILYPTAALRRWIRKGSVGIERPSGIIRESLDDRVAKEKLRVESSKRSSAKSSEEAVEIYLHTKHTGIDEDNSDGFATREKIPSSTKFPSEKTAKNLKYKEASKQRAIYEKYDRGYQETALRALSKENGGNLNTLEKERPAKTPEELANALYNKFDASFLKSPLKKSKAVKWLRTGITQRIATGRVSDIRITKDNTQARLDENVASDLLTSGFYNSENNHVDREVMRDIVNKETVAASSSVKSNVATQLIPEKVSKAVDDPEVFNTARKGAALYALSQGATYDSRFKTTSFSINAEHGDEVRDFMEKDCGIKFDINGEQKYAEAALQGFANVIEAIKHNEPIVNFDEEGKIIGKFPDISEDQIPEGFKELDWYFDNFKFDTNPDKFDLTMMAYEENTEDDKFGKKLDEYMAYRASRNAEVEVDANPDKEKEDYDELPTFGDETIPIENIEKLTIDELKKVAEQLFTDPGITTATGVKGNYVRNPNTGQPDIDDTRVKYFVHHSACIKSICPDLKTTAGVFISSRNRMHFYLMNEFTCNNRPVLITCPIMQEKDNASYSWIGDEGDPSNKWKQFLVKSNDPKAPAVKKYVTQNNQVHRYKHRRGDGLCSLANMWANIEADIYYKTGLAVPKTPQNIHLTEDELKRLERRAKARKYRESAKQQQKLDEDVK